MRICCLALAVLLLSPAAHARSTGGSGSLLDLSLDQLMALQVRTASRTDEAYFSTPAAISVITADQIRAARPCGRRSQRQPTLFQQPVIAG